MVKSIRMSPAPFFVLSEFFLSERRTIDISCTFLRCIKELSSVATALLNVIMLCPEHSTGEHGNRVDEAGDRAEEDVIFARTGGLRGDKFHAGSPYRSSFE